MKFSWKKLLAGVLTSVLLVSACVGSAFAAANPFSDVSSTKWYYTNVLRVNQAGLMDGMGNGCFEPESALTREQFITILGKWEKINTADYADVDINAIFSDVPQGKWYSPYVAWAYENGITLGVGDGLFGLEQNVTREQMAKFMISYCDAKRITLPTCAVSDFTDQSSISSWAKQYATLCHMAGIFNGDETGSFHPSRTATRGEAAKVFCNLLDIVDTITTDSTTSDSTTLAPNKTVYVSNSNKVHSVSDCSGMKHYTEMTLAQAQAKGYAMCSNCW